MTTSFECWITAVLARMLSHQNRLMTKQHKMSGVGHTRWSTLADKAVCVEAEVFGPRAKKATVSLSQSEN